MKGLLSAKGAACLDSSQALNRLLSYQIADQIHEFVDGQPFRQSIGHDALRLRALGLNVRLGYRVLFPLIVGNRDGIGGLGRLDADQGTAVVKRKRERLESRGD